MGNLTDFLNLKNIVWVAVEILRASDIVSAVEPRARVRTWASNSQATRERERSRKRKR